MYFQAFDIIEDNRQTGISLLILYDIIKTTVFVLKTT